MFFDKKTQARNFKDLTQRINVNLLQEDAKKKKKQTILRVNNKMMSLKNLERNLKVVFGSRAYPEITMINFHPQQQAMQVVAPSFNASIQ